ncbi:MAG TPA: hypothetical protein VFD74_07420 [Thermoleophilia bacterium]|nr:hypothetical protein [Thermoleophilia bacterium]
MARKAHGPRLDLIGGLDSVGSRLAGRANERLERSPVRAPARLLFAGVVMLISASVLAAASAGEPGSADSPGQVAVVVATLLYAGGGLSLVIGLAGLLSALVVHILGMKGRSR